MWESPRNWPSLSLKWRDNVAILYARLTRRAALRIPMRLGDVTAYLDDYLRVREVPDAPQALNGLQLANGGEITRVAAAVDLCEATVRLAAEARADLLLVHHGLFWGGPRPLTGPSYRRVASLLQCDIAVYSAHLPLDRHPEVGNNAVLARELGVSVRGEFGEEYGVTIGVWGELDLERMDLRQRLTELLGSPPRLMAFGPARTRRVGIVTGGAGSLIGQAAAAGPGTHITGGGGPHT